jgi:hypothetical protein
MLPLLAVLAVATHNVDLPKVFARTLPRVRAHTSVPILLPQRFPSQFAQLFPSGAGHRRSWSLSLGAVRNCGGATACFVADFEGRRGGRPFGQIRVRLARGRVGRFQPLSCGASCSPPSISWRERGCTFSIQANVAGPGSDRRVLTRMANSAIRHGPRR